MKIKSQATAGLFCFLLTIFNLSDAKESPDLTLSTAPSPYPVYDSGAWADWRFFSTEINWIDDKRILFKTIKDNDKTKIGTGPFNLSVWEIGRDVKPYTDNFSSVTACISGNMIHRTQKEANDSVRRFYGMFGEEKPFEFPKTKGAFFDEMNCRPIDSPEIIEKRKTRTIKLLLDRHGYLDLGPLRGIESTNNTPVTFYRKDDATGIVLPIKRKSAGIIRYYPFKDAYFIHRIVGGAWVGKAETTWWLYPNGKVIEVPVPHGPWTKGGSVGFYPTRKGIFVRYDTFKSNQDPGDAGGYLVDGQKITRLIVGHLKEPVISPDGCKVAFSYHAYPDATLIKDPGRITLKMIDLCMEKKKP